MPYIPTPSSGGRNRYAEIMSQFGQSQPFSFFGMPSGGFNPYASDYTGGFTPYQRTFTPQPIVNPVEPTVPMVGGGGGGGRGGVDREGPSAWSQMTPAERAAYYAANPIEGSIALGMQDVFGNATLLGNAAKYFGADGWYDSRLEKQGYDPKQFAYGPPDLRGGTTSDGLGSPTLSGGFVQAPGEAGRGGPAPVAPAPTSGFTPYSGTLNAVRSYDAMGREISPTQAALGGANVVVSDARSAAEAQARADAAAAAQAAQQAADARADAESRDSTNRGGGGRDGGDGMGSPGGSFGGVQSPGEAGRGANYAKGGHVSMQHLLGPNPDGPDDGYAALKDGEYVINDKAVKKYGIELMEAINSGKISKGKLRGLLEM
jgi:hypothetical protein